MNAPKRIAIVNAYSVQNRGDAAIVYAMVRFIRTVAPESQIDILSSFAEENREYYSKCGANSLPAIFDIGAKGSMIGKYIQWLQTFLLALFFPQSHKFAPIREADWVLAAGGGYLYSSRRGPLGMGLLGNCFHLWLGTRFKKLTVLFPQSIGPLSSAIDRMLCTRSLRNLALVCCREKGSLAQARKMKIQTARLIPDIAFLLADPTRHRTLPTTPQKIGISVLDWRFANRSATEKDITDYLEKIKQAVCLLHEKFPGLTVEIFPQVTVGKGLGDQTVSTELYKMIDAPWASVADFGNCSYPDEIMEQYARMDVFIGSRMHSAILAMCAGTPTVALAYQPKTQGTFEFLDLGDFSLDITQFTSEELTRKMLLALDQANRIRTSVISAKTGIQRELLEIFHASVSL